MNKYPNVPIHHQPDIIGYIRDTPSYGEIFFNKIKKFLKERSSRKMKCKVCEIKDAKCKNMCDSCRLKKWRKYNPGKIKAYLEKNDERIKKHQRKYYEENKEALNLMSKRCRQRNGYAYEKTPARKARARIRVMTNNKYPLKGNDCIFCDSAAEHRHHTTEPMEVDKFIFCCKIHHDKIHGKNSVVEVQHE